MKPHYSLTNFASPLALRHIEVTLQRREAKNQQWRKKVEERRREGEELGSPILLPSLPTSTLIPLIFFPPHFPLSHPHYLKYYLRSIFFMFLLFYPHGCPGKALRCNIHYRIKLAKVRYHFDFSNPSHCIVQTNILHLVTISNFQVTKR